MMYEAKHWMFGTGLYPTMPDIAEIQKYKDMGFNTIQFGEITYGEQPKNFDDILAGRNGWTKTNNPFIKTVRNIQNAGMKVIILLNPNRYDAVHLFINNEAAKSKYITHLNYIVEIGVDGIEIEEPTFWNVEKSNDFLRLVRSKVPRNILLGFNYPSNEYSNIIGSGFDAGLMDRERIFDFMSTQPGKGPAPDYLITFQDNIAPAVAAWKRYMPNTHINAGLFVNYSVGGGTGARHNWNIVQNTQDTVNAGMDIAMFPSDLIRPAEVAGITSALKNVQCVPTNLIKNSSFTTLNNWSFYTNGTGNFNIISDEGVVDVTVPSTNNNSQLYQQGIILKTNSQYKLKFDLYSTVAGKSVGAVVLNHDSPYTQIKLYDVITTTLKTSYETTFLTGSTVPYNVRVMFWFSNSGKYYLDNVTLEEICPEEIYPVPVIPQKGIGAGILLGIWLLGAGILGAVIMSKRETKYSPPKEYLKYQSTSE